MIDILYSILDIPNLTIDNIAYQSGTFKRTSEYYERSMGFVDYIHS